MADTETKKATHPKYSEMIATAIETLKEKKGSSRAAIIKFITSKYKVSDNPNVVNNRVKLFLKKGVESHVLTQVKGSGASGSFKLAKKATVKPEKAVKKSAQKATAKPEKAVKKPKKVTFKSPKKFKANKAEKSPSKTVKSPKKLKVTKSPKTAKSPRKPKAARSPLKAAKPKSMAAVQKSTKKATKPKSKKPRK